MWKKENPHALSVGMQTGAPSVENSMEFPLTKMDLLYDSLIPLLGAWLRKLTTLI